MGYISGQNKVSGLIVDANLNMGAHNITLGAGQTVDGKDVSGLEPHKITNGTYNGNDTQNRSVEHTLGEIPKLVVIYDDLGQLFGMNIEALNKIKYLTHTAMAVITHNSTTSVYFYVGMTAAGYNHSANETGRTYYWTAFV